MSTAASRKELNKRDVKENLEEIILRMSIRGPVYGYKLIKNVKNYFGVSLSQSEVYPSLWELDKKGYLNSEKEQNGSRPRKVYYSVAFKTLERLKEIRDVKNQNRRKINELSSSMFSVVGVDLQ